MSTTARARPRGRATKRRPAAAHGSAFESETVAAIRDLARRMDRLEELVWTEGEREAPMSTKVGL